MAIRDLIPAWQKRTLPVRRIENENIFQMIQREMNHLFDNFFNDFQLSNTKKTGIGLFPQIDIQDKDMEIVVEAEVPGMDEKDIDISLSNNVLTLKGEKKQEKEIKKDHYYHVERSYGEFRREIPLHCEIEDDKVQAKYKNGVLKITLPKTPAAQRKTKCIPIQIS